jgi:hypothetical protein
MADKKKRTFVKLMTPIGRAAYAWLNQPDAKFNPDKPSYKLTLVLDEGPEADELEKKIIEAGRQAAEKDGVKLKKNFGIPIKRFDDDDEDKRKPEFEGKVRFSFKSPKKPLQVDAKKVALPKNIFVASGDDVRASISVAAWSSPLGSGLSVYLNGVQLIAKNSTGGGSSDDFDEYEGGYSAPATTESESAEDSEDEDL